MIRTTSFSIAASFPDNQVPDIDSSARLFVDDLHDALLDPRSGKNCIVEHQVAGTEQNERLCQAILQATRLSVHVRKADGCEFEIVASFHGKGRGSVLLQVIKKQRKNKYRGAIDTWKYTEVIDALPPVVLSR